MKRLNSSKTRDRLSELPDPLILQILSFLEMRDVVRTSLLSRRWEGLWTTIPCLYFSGPMENDLVQMQNFINRVLMLWKGTKILKFNVSFCIDFDESLSSDLDLWVRFATERKVEELYIHFPYDWELIDAYTAPEYPPLYLPPRCLYSCSSIQKLSLVGCNLHIRWNVHWDQLKSLTIRSCNENLINQVQNVIDLVVSGTPQLEIFELYVHSQKLEKLSIQSSSLKKLSIENICILYNYLDMVLTIRAPNLEALVILGPPYSECLLMDVQSLTDVTLDFDDEWDLVLGETLEQILPSIQHVEAVKLSYHCFKILGCMKGKYSIPQLPSVKLLRFSCDYSELNEIIGVLEIFPKLKMLGIDNKYSSHSFEDCVVPTMPEENVIKSFLMQLRTVEICLYWYKSSIFQFVEFLLKHSSLIEKIVIQQRGDRSYMIHYPEDLFRTAQELLSLQRSFPAVELIFCLEGSSSVFQ